MKTGTFFLMNVRFTFLLVLISFGAKAQYFENDIKSSFEENPKLEYRLDSRHSFINQRGVRVFGVKLGLQYNEKISVGIGFNRLSSEVINRSILSFNRPVRLGFWNISPYVEYVFYRDRKWELSIPVQLGFGSSYYTTPNTDSKVLQKFVLSYEPAITFQYSIIPYLGLGAGIGYRFMIIGNSDIEERFNSPVFLLKTRFYFNELYRDIYNN